MKQTNTYYGLFGKTEKQGAICMVVLRYPMTNAFDDDNLYLSNIWFVKKIVTIL